MNKTRVTIAAICVVTAVLVLLYYGSNSSGSLKQQFFEAEDATYLSETSALKRLYECLYGALMNQYGEEGVREVIAMRVAFKNNEKPSASSSAAMLKLIVVSPLCGAEAQSLGLQ